MIRFLYHVTFTYRLRDMAYNPRAYTWTLDDFPTVDLRS